MRSKPVDGTITFAPVMIIPCNGEGRSTVVRHARSVATLISVTPRLCCAIAAVGCGTVGLMHANVRAVLTNVTMIFAIAAMILVPVAIFFGAAPIIPRSMRLSVYICDGHLGR